MTNNIKLFLVESPFQLLCAKEADMFFHENKKGMYVLLNLYGAENLNQMKSLAEKLEIKNKILLNLNNQGKLQKLRTIQNCIKDIIFSEKLEYVFLGDYRSFYFNLIINKYNLDSKLIILDDGNANFIMLSKLKNNELHYTNPSKFKRLLYHFIGYDFTFRLPKGVFTYFGQQFQLSINNVDIYHNGFSFLKKSLTEKTITDDVFFLGTKIAESGFISYMDYIKQLKLVVNHLQHKYPKAQIYYLPHREEADKKVKLLDQIQGLNLLRTNIPFEVYIVKISELPLCIASFYSGALNTAKTLLGNETCIISYKLDFSKFLDFKNKKDILKNIELSYQNLSLQEIEMIDNY